MDFGVDWYILRSIYAGDYSPEPSMLIWGGRQEPFTTIGALVNIRERLCVGFRCCEIGQMVSEGEKTEVWGGERGGKEKKTDRPWSARGM